MPSTIGEVSETSDVLPVVNEPPKGKRIIRYLLHVNHFFVTFLLASTVLVIECRCNNAFWILYLVPFLVAILVLETFYLFRRAPPRSLIESHLAPRRLIRRSFVYQISAAFTAAWIWNYSWKFGYNPIYLAIMEMLVWFDGIALLLLALTAAEYDFLDWVEEPQPEAEEPVLLYGERQREAQDDNSELDMSKRCVQYIFHIVHFSVAIILLTFIWMHMQSAMGSPVGFYLLPLILIVIIVELSHLLHRRPPARLVNSFFIPQKLLHRAFIYQLAGAYAIVCSGYFGHGSSYGVFDAFVRGFVVWMVGVMLFGISLASEEYGFEDWVEDPALRARREKRGHVGLDGEEPVRGRVGLPDELV
jgi:hypothetical protein